MIHPALLHVPTPNWAAMAWSMPYGWYEPPPPPDAVVRCHRPAATTSTLPAAASERRCAGSRRWRAGTAGVTGTLRFGRGIRGGRARRRDGGSAQRRPEARPDAARPAGSVLVPAAAFRRRPNWRRRTARGSCPARSPCAAAPRPSRCGSTRSTACPTARSPSACAERWSAGRAGSRRRVALELTLVAAPEPVSFAPPCIAAAQPALEPYRCLVSFLQRVAPESGGPLVPALQDQQRPRRDPQPPAGLGVALLARRPGQQRVGRVDDDLPHPPVRLAGQRERRRLVVGVEQQQERVVDDAARRAGRARGCPRR